MNALKIAIVAILIFNLGTSVFKWFVEDPTPEYYAETLASEGMSLKALTVLTKEIRSGQELERRINEKGSINNLDLNSDDVVDYISVTEFGTANSKIGYSLVVEPVSSEKQEIATVTIEKNQNQAEIQVIGNEQIYGENAIYNDSAPIERNVTQSRYHGSGLFPIMATYFIMRPLWASPWNYGNYPSHYSPSIRSNSANYANQTRSYQSKSVKPGANPYQKKSGLSINNPNNGKIANRGINRSLVKPTATQKKFQVNNRSSVRSGGFGNSGKRTLSAKKSTRSSSIFGGSLFKSSGSGSRSFSFGGK